MLVHIALPELRNKPGRNLFGLAFSLKMAFIILVTIRVGLVPMGTTECFAAGRFLPGLQNFQLENILDLFKVLWTRPKYQFGLIQSILYPSRTFQTGPKTTQFHILNTEQKNLDSSKIIFAYAPKYFNFTYRSSNVLFLLVSICLDDAVSTKIRYTPEQGVYFITVL